MNRMLENVNDALREASAYYFDGDEELLFYLLLVTPLLIFVFSLSRFIRKKDAKYRYAAEYDADQYTGADRDFVTSSDESEVPEYEISMEELMESVKTMSENDRKKEKRLERRKEETPKDREPSQKEENEGMEIDGNGKGQSSAPTDPTPASTIRRRRREAKKEG